MRVPTSRPSLPVAEEPWTATDGLTVKEEKDNESMNTRLSVKVADDVVREMTQLIFQSAPNRDDDGYSLILVMLFLELSDVTCLLSIRSRCYMLLWIDPSVPSSVEQSGSS